jgi:ABC-2 type transport system ATP-binding protein
MSLIRTVGLTRAFGPVVAVDQLSLTVAEGELFGLVGPDGAGKSTTLRLVAGILEPTAGEAWVAGYHSVRQADALKAHIGYLSQRSGLYPDLTVGEHLRFYAELHCMPRTSRAESIRRLLTLTQLAPFEQRLASELSGGMKQKLALACALVHAPKVLLLDEPTCGLDAVSRRELWRLLGQLLQQRVTIVVATAYLDEAERCSRLALLHQGRVRALGTPQQLKQLMPGSLLEIRGPDPRRIAALLGAHQPTWTVTQLGDRVHVAAPDPAEATTQAQALLVQAQLPPLAIRPIQPSLEDVFVSVLSGESAGDPAEHRGPKPSSAAGAPAGLN